MTFDHRRANRTQRQLLERWREPGAPPETPAYALPSQPQPIPRADLASQVFSSYPALPTGARMFNLAVEADKVDLTDRWQFIFEIAPQPGWVTVLREVEVLPVVNYGLNAVEVYIPPPGRTFVSLLRDSSIVPNVNIVGGAGLGPFLDPGVPWQVYLVGGESNRLGVVVQFMKQDVGNFGGGEGSTTCIFRGEYLRSRNLPLELETGHDAPIVRPRGDAR